MNRGGFLLVIFLLGLLAFSFWPGAGQTWVEIDVADGATGFQIARHLKETGLIRSSVPFRAWMRLRGAQQKLHAGRYRFSAGRSAFWLVDDMIHGRTEKVRLVIPEGFASWQIADRLEELGVSQADAFKKVVADQKLEGFLFPATYELNVGFGAEKTTRALAEQFNLHWTPALAKRADEMGMTKEQVVTFASIIEREVRVREELPIVSALYHNRLKRNMPLQADPTVQYALGYWKTRLTYDEYRNTNSPYNTYVHEGLPPGPICNPGMDAIKAALWPAASDALYLLAQDDGHHTFSTSYKEHTNKVNKRNRALRGKR
jgi:UPF0755 protein